jgi:hypothetical protein
MTLNKLHPTSRCSMIYVNVPTLYFDGTVIRKMITNKKHFIEIMSNSCNTFIGSLVLRGIILCHFRVFINLLNELGQC